MKKLFLGSVAFVALGLGTAFAAERPLPAPVAAPVVPAYTNWSGCHAGAVAGVAFGSSNRTSVFDPAVAGGGAGLPKTNNFDLSGFTGGGDLGCDWQWGVWVFGVEGDWSADNKSGQAFGLPRSTSCASMKRRSAGYPPPAAGSAGLGGTGASST